MTVVELVVIIQIIAEVAPISSSGHVRLVACWSNELLSPLLERLITLVHLPTMLIVSIFFRHRWWPLLRNIRRYYTLAMRISLLTLISSSLSVPLYLLGKELPMPVPLWMGFLMTAFLLLVPLICSNSVARHYTVHDAIILGIVQGCAWIPGISRFALVYTAARYLGLSLRHSFEITWLISIPLLAGAVCKDGIVLLHNGSVVMINSTMVFSVVGASIASYFLFLVVARLARTGHLYWFAPWLLIVASAAALIC